MQNSLCSHKLSPSIFSLSLAWLDFNTYFCSFLFSRYVENTFSSIINVESIHFNKLYLKQVKFTGVWQLFKVCFMTFKTLLLFALRLLLKPICCFQHCEPCQKPLSWTGPPPSEGGQGDWWQPLKEMWHDGHYPTSHKE